MKRALLILAFIIPMAVAAWGKKHQITMDDYPLIGTVYLDALDTSDWYHIDDYSCTQGDDKHAPTCSKDRIFSKFKLANGKSGPFAFIQDDDIWVIINLSWKVYDPLDGILSECSHAPVDFNKPSKPLKDMLSECDVKVHYRESGSYVYVPYLAGKDKKGNNVLREAKYSVAAIDGPDLRDK